MCYLEVPQVLNYLLVLPNLALSDLRRPADLREC